MKIKKEKLYRERKKETKWESDREENANKKDGKKHIYIQRNKGRKEEIEKMKERKIM